MKVEYTELGRLIIPAKLRRAGNGNYPILSMTMHGGLIDQADKFKKRVASKDTSQYKIVKKNQLVVGFPIDEGVLDFQVLYDEAIVSPAYDIWNIRKDQKVDIKYLERFLRCPKALFFYASKLRSTTARRRTLPKDIFLSLSVPLPPLSEQKRIAAILDKTDAIRRKRQQAIKLSDEFLRATFLDMFGDPVTNPKRWEVKPLSKLCDVRDGTHDSPKYVQEGYPLITSKNVRGGLLDFSDVNLISEEDYLQINKRSAVDMGDIIMPMIGTIGNPVLVETSKKFAIKNVALIKFKTSNIERNYILHLLKSHYFEWIIQKSNRGGTQKFIALKDIRGFPIPVPDKKSQEKFSAFCLKFKTLKANKNTIISVSSDLFNSLTQRAFRGEL